MERIVEELRDYNYVNNVGLSEAEINEIADEYFRENHDFDKEYETGMLDVEFERLIEARFNDEVNQGKELPTLVKERSAMVKEDLENTIDFREEKEFEYVDMNEFAKEYASKHNR